MYSFLGFSHLCVYTYMRAHACTHAHTRTHTHTLRILTKMESFYNLFHLSTYCAYLSTLTTNHFTSIMYKYTKI